MKFEGGRVESFVVEPDRIEGLDSPPESMDPQLDAGRTSACVIECIKNGGNMLTCALRCVKTSK
jgi:hypothetical protein